MKLRCINKVICPFYSQFLFCSDSVDRGAVPRMPWHDVGMRMFGAPARDVARHFILRWNATKVNVIRE